MKKKNKKVSERINTTSQNVSMERKKDVILIKNNVDQMSDEDIKELLQLVENENQQMKDMYYAFNTPIVNTRQRTFKDLVKKFINHLKEGKYLDSDISVTNNKNMRKI